MQIIRELEAARFSGVVLTIGNFDGVHRGHRALLEAGLRRAAAAGTKLVVMTFDPHPAVVLTPDRIPATLTPLDQKLRLFEEAGVGAVVVAPSRPELFSIPPDEFITGTLVRLFSPRAIVEGDSFRYGQHRLGNTHTLRSAGQLYGFEVEIVPPVRINLGGSPDSVISSSLIRHLVSSGTVSQAAICLGRPYGLVGRVERGAGRGRTLGFPTANLAVESQLIPAEGVYAGQVTLLKEAMTATAPPNRAASMQSGANPVAAAVSIGNTPTFSGDQVLVEAYLLDFDGDLYGRRLRIDFLDWLRPQMKFASVPALRTQIELDVLSVRSIARAHPHAGA